VGKEGGNTMDRVDSEEILLARSKAGEHNAFMELVRRNSKFALRAIRSIVPNLTDAEDIMQDTLMKAYKNLPHFNQRCKFSTWLTRIAINTALAHLRKRKSSAEISFDLEIDSGDFVPILVVDERVDTEKEIIQKQAIAKLRGAIDSLPADMRAYINQWCSEDVTHRKVALSLGITVAAGKSRSTRARQKLESTLSPMFLHAPSSLRTNPAMASKTPVDSGV
jgi:RNA polymerase sigma-70 factor (ECF subfamily)